MRPITALTGAILVVAASSAFALPPEWNTFAVCTLEFKPRRPAGKFETIVYASEVVTKCYATAPPSAPPTQQGETDPRRVDFEVQTADVIPCSKITGTRRTLQDRLSDVRDELRELAGAMDRGEAALRVATEVSRELEREAREKQAACTRQQNRYQAELIRLVAQLEGQCRPGGTLESRMDCLDQKMQEAERRLANSSGLLATQVCDVARGYNDYYTRQDQVRIDLERALTRSWDRQIQLRREAMAIERSLSILDDREKSGDCKK